MMADNTKKTGYSVTTYKIRFYTNQTEYLKLTQEIYNEIIEAYYNLLFRYTELLALSTQKCLRELEKLTIIGITGEKPAEYFEQNAPTELRRAAINQAIGLVKSYFELLKMSEENEKFQSPNKATSFHCSLILYKGMYKNVESNGSVRIKLFDGKKWRWFDAKFKNWNFPEEAQILSPTLVIHKDYVMAHIPVRRKIEDVTPIKERMKHEEVRVCGIAFSNTDKVATCVVINKTGEVVKTLFISGGNEYKSLITKLFNKQKKNILENKKLQEIKQNHKTYREKANRIINHYAHVMSRQIVDFCIENKVEVIVTALATKDKAYYYTKSSKSRPIYLREKITEFIIYKAYREGILSTTVLRKDKASKCYKCSGAIKSRKLKTYCENGHQLDYYFNYAINVALEILKKYENKA